MSVIIPKHKKYNIDPLVFRPIMGEPVTRQVEMPDNALLQYTQSVGSMSVRNTTHMKYHLDTLVFRPIMSEPVMT